MLFIFISPYINICKVSNCTIKDVPMVFSLTGEFYSAHIILVRYFSQMRRTRCQIVQSDNKTKLS